MNILRNIFKKILTDDKHKVYWRALATTLAGVVVFVTTYSLILPAITMETSVAEDTPGFYMDEDSEFFEVVPDPDDEGMTSEYSEIAEDDDAAISDAEWDGDVDFDDEDELDSGAVVSGIQDGLLSYTIRELTREIKNEAAKEKIKVHLSFDENASIPDGTQLEVFDILDPENKFEYDPYVEAAEDAVREDDSSWTDFSIRLYALNLLYGEETVIPENKVSVDLEITPHITSENCKVLFFDDVDLEQNTDEVSLPSVQEDVSFEYDKDGSIEHIKFDSDSFSMIGIVEDKSGNNDVSDESAQTQDADDAHADANIEADTVSDEETPVDANSVVTSTEDSETEPETETENETLPAQEFSGSTETMQVQVIADEGAFPDGTTMVLKDVVDDQTLSAIEDAAIEDASKDMEGGRAKVSSVHAVDITFLDVDGNEIEPLKPIRVFMTPVDVPEENSENPVVVHVDNEGNAETIKTIETIQELSLPENNEEVLTPDSVAFEAGSFSVYALVYTVDFHYEVNGKMYEFSIPGGGFVTLQQLVEVLGIANSDAYSENASDDAGSIGDFSEEDDEYSFGEVPGVKDGVYGENGENVDNSAEVPGTDSNSTTNTAISFNTEGAAYKKAITLNNVAVSEKTREFVSDIASVEFSNPELVWVGKADTAITVGQLKSANGLEVQYSVELTEEQIDEINSSTVESGDWALISVLPFDTEESLTVTMKDGEMFTIHVTDARDPLGLDSRSFAMVYHTEDETLSVQSTLAWADIGSRPVTYTADGGTEYCDPEATAWKFTYDSARSDEENGIYYYFISAPGYHSESNEELYLNIGNTPLLVSGTNAVSMRVEKDTDGNYLISDGVGNYLQRNSSEWGYLQTFSTVGNVDGGAYAHFRFCLPEDSDDDSSHKASLISAADTQPGQKIIAYQRVLQSDDTFDYYAIDGDGNLVKVYESGDSIYWKGNQSIEWTLTDLGNGYYTLYNETTGKYLTPKNDGIVHNAWALDFEGDAKHLSISLPGREAGTYTSQIASWDYNANVTYGMTVSGDATDPAITSNDLLSSQYFYFAARDPIVHDQLSTVATVDSVSKGITIKMYDWGNPTGTDAAHDSLWWDAYTDGDSHGTKGIIQTRLDWMQTIMGDGSDSYSERTLQQGLTSRTLDEGTKFPDATYADTDGTKHNLSELFDDQYLTSSNANHLFLQSIYDETGFFKYSSFENYAYLGDGNDFTVYEQIGTPSTRGTQDPANGNYTSVDNPPDYQKVFMRGNFMPYNDINPSMTYRFNEYDPDMNALSEDDPRRNERLYFIENADPDYSRNPEASANYFFGMTVDAKFSQNPGGYADNGDPMLFEFNGDDDMWVYIDDVLVLDVGGVHDAFRGRINFRTGTVNVYIAGHGTINNVESDVNDYETTIKDMFWKARKFPDGTPWTDYNDSRVSDYFTGNTFKDYSTHDFKMIYMERGASASNLEMMFNLPVLTSSQFRVKKEMPETVTGEAIQEKYSDAAFYYKAFVKVNNEWQAVTKNFLNTWLESEIENEEDRLPKYDNGNPVVWVNSNGEESNVGTETVFEVKPGDTACFPAFDDSVEWYVVEVEPEVQSLMLNDFSVTNSDPDTSVNGDPDNVHQYSNDFTRYLKSNVNTVGKRNIVTYTNKPRNTLVNELQIKKKILGDAYNENDAFEYRIFLESKEGAMVAYDLGEYYQIDAQGRYIYYQNGERRLQSENPDGPYTYTLDGQTVTSNTPRYTEHTSTNGSLGDIRDGDTIIIKGLMEGTEFYVYERTYYDYMSKDDTLINGKYVFDGTEVTDAAIRATHENWPNHPVGTLFDAPTGLDDLLSYYNASAYEQSKAADGIIIQGEDKDAKVLVKNRPCGEISVEKEWLDEDGEALEDHPDDITYTIYQLKHDHEWAVYNSATGTWNDTQAAEGDGWHTISDNDHTKVEERRCRFDYCDHYTETRTTIEPCAEHEWSEWTVTMQPTCTATGFEKRTCSVCGAVETRTIAKLGHDWDIIDGEEHWVVATQPSCTQAGEETIVCKRCDLVIHRPYGAPLGHDYVESITTPATCTEDGVMSLVCSRCGDTQSDVTIPALGHDMGEWYGNTATCTEGGTEQRDCQRGGCSYKENRATEPLGHDMDWRSNGNGTETGTCSRCGYTETRQQQNLFPGTTDLVLDDFTWLTEGGQFNPSGIYKYGDEYWVTVKNQYIDVSNAANGPAGVENWGVTVRMNMLIQNASDIYESNTGNIQANVQKGTLVRGSDGNYYVRTNGNEWSSAPTSSSTPDNDGWYLVPSSGNRQLNTLFSTRSLNRSALMHLLSESTETVDPEEENAEEDTSDQEIADADKSVSEPQSVNKASLSNRSLSSNSSGDASGIQLRSAGLLRSVSVTQSDLTLAQLLTDLSLTGLNVKNPDTGNTLTEYKPGQTLETKNDSETLADTNLWHTDHIIPVSEDDNIEYRYYVVETDPVANGDYTVTYTGQTNGLVPSGTGSHNVKITNQKKPEIGNLLISKATTGATGDTANQTFTFKVTLTAPADVTLESSYSTVMTGSNAGTGTQTVTSGEEFTVTLKGGDTWQINDLPNGTKYSVSEGSPLPAGWTLTSASPQTGTISKNTTQSVEFTNVYSEVTKAPEVTKVLAGRTTWRNDESYTFEIAPEGDATTAAVTAGKIVMPSPLTATATATAQTAVFGNITFKDEGTYYFTITEQSGSDTTMSYSHKEVSVMVIVTKKNGVLSAVMTYAEAKDDEGVTGGVLTYAETVQEFINEQLGSLTIDKTVRVTGGRPDQDAFPSGTYTYPVTVTTVIGGNTYYVQDTDGTLGTSAPATPLSVTAGPLGTAGTELNISNLHYGNYTVTELSPDTVEVPGFSFVLSEGQSESVTSDEGTVGDTPGEAHLFNYYMRGASWTPEVDKWLNGIPYTENAVGYAGYTFTLSEPETQNTINAGPGHGPGHGPGQESSHTDTETTGEDGKAVFNRIDYRRPDLGDATSKDYYYTITENRPEQAQDSPYIADNILYDTKAIYVVVTVTRSGGAMSAHAAYYSDAGHTQSLSTAYFNNTELGTLTVTKSVTGSYTATDGDTYPFTVKNGSQYVTGTLETEGGTSYTYSGLSDTDPGYTVKANETLTFTNLPVGTYVVEEGSVSKTGYVITTTYKVNSDGSTSESATAQVVKGQTTAVAINNHYRDAQLVIKKTVAGVEPDDMTTVADSITITVKDSANNTILNNVKLSESPFSADNGVYTATLKSTDGPSSSWAQYIVPDGTYTVTETMAEVTGYTLRSSTYQITAKENVGKTDAESGTGYELQLTDVDTSAGEIDYTNTYVKLVDIEVNKEWEIGIDTRWPDDVDSVVVKLRQSVNGADPVDVDPARTATITKDNWTLTVADVEAMEDGEAKTAAQNSLATRFIKDLPKYDDNGNLISYSVVETTPESGFNVTYTPAGTTTGGLITVKNQKEVEPFELTVKKEWKKGSTDNAVETTVTDELSITYEVWRKAYTDAARTALYNEDGAPERVTGLTAEDNGFTGVLNKDNTTVTSDGGQQTVTPTPWEQTVTALPAQGTITSGEEPEVTGTVVYYSYYVKEVKVSGGMFGSEGVALEQTAETPAASGDDAGKLVLVNRLREYEAVKIWENVDDEELTSETAPASVTYKLYRKIDGVRDPDFENVATLTSSDKSGNDNITWKKLWKGLPIEGSFTYTPEGGEETTKTGIYDYAVEETKIVYGGTEYSVSGNVDSTGRWLISQIENTVTNKLNETEFEFSKVWMVINRVVPWGDNPSIEVKITRTTGTGNDMITENTGYIIIGKDDSEISSVTFGGDSTSSAKIVRLSTENNTYSYKLVGIEKYYQGDTTKEWTYSIEERQIEGYNKPKYYTIQVISGKEVETDHPYSTNSISVPAGDTGGVKIVNDMITVALPNTGGPGTNMLYLFGFMLTALAGAGFVMKRKRRFAA